MVKLEKYSLLEFKDRWKPCKLCGIRKSVKYRAVLIKSDGSKLFNVHLCNTCIVKLLSNKENNNEIS